MKLKQLFDDVSLFTEATSPIYGERNGTLHYRVVDLLWRPVGIRVRFVLVIHPERGRKILLSTDLSLEPIPIIQLYGVRFKIEVSFKQAIHTIGTYSYHFWMLAMKPRPRRSGNQYPHRECSSYRDQVRRKLAAYHCHIQLGVIAQGLSNASPSSTLASSGVNSALGFAPFVLESFLQNRSLLSRCAMVSRYFSRIRPKTIPS